MGMEKAAKDFNANLFVFTNYVGTRETEESIMASSQILSLPDFHTFDGVVLVPNTIHNPIALKTILEDIKKLDKPVVSLDRKIEGISCVGIDSYAAEFEMVEHEAVFTIEEMNNLNLEEKGVGVKNLFLRDEKGKNHFLIVAKDETKIDLKGLKDKINSTKLSFASEERLQKYLGVTRGSVSPLCILNDEENAVKVFIEKSVENEARIAVHPNDNTATVYIATKDVENIIKEHGNSVEYITL